jgi:ureidoacrylate peracid hydrolase
MPASIRAVWLVNFIIPFPRSWGRTTINLPKALSEGPNPVPWTAHHGFSLIAGKDKAHQQIDHIAFEVDNVRALSERLKARGTHFQEELHDGPYGLTIYVSDPDNNRIELYQVGLKT